MTDAEWAAFAAELDHAFVGDFGPTGPDDRNGGAQEAVYRRHLGGVPYDVAAAAVALLVEDGKVHLPKPGEVREAVRRVTTTPAPPFAQAWRGITSAYDHHGATPEAVAVIVAEAGEGAGRFVVSHGLAELMREPIDGDGQEGRAQGGAVRYRLEQAYKAYCEQAAEDERVGVAIARATEREGIAEARRRAELAGESVPPKVPRRLEAWTAPGATEDVVTYGR